jgi:Ca2+:H+ antiporter
MSRNKATGLLVVVTVTLAVMSEVMTGAIEPTAASLGLTPVFAGVFMLALVSNVPQLYNAVVFGRTDKMDLAIGVTIGASTQLALLVAHALVFLGAVTGQDGPNPTIVLRGAKWRASPERPRSPCCSGLGMRSHN